MTHPLMRREMPMRFVMIAWALPLCAFWGWFLLSFHDVNFGSVYLSRGFHDLLFRLYGEILGIDPARIPWMAAKACVFDTILLLGILAFRRRKQIRSYLAA